LTSCSTCISHSLPCQTYTKTWASSSIQVEHPDSRCGVTLSRDEQTPNSSDGRHQQYLYCTRTFQYLRVCEHRTSDVRLPTGTKEADHTVLNVYFGADVVRLADHLIVHHTVPKPFQEWAGQGKTSSRWGACRGDWDTHCATLAFPVSLIL
jgi:hypothetical protein